MVDDEPSIHRNRLPRIESTPITEVITASNGKEALELYEKHREGIRLVILDLIMPGMDGRECLQALRKMDPKVRVLIATGQSTQGMAEDLRELGLPDLSGSRLIYPNFWRRSGRLLMKIKREAIVFSTRDRSLR